MLSQNNKRITNSESRDTAAITWIVMHSIYSLNNTYQDTKNLEHKTYRIKKLEFPRIRTKNHSQTQTQTGLTARYEKPYQNRTVIRKNAQCGTVTRIKQSMNLYHF